MQVMCTREEDEKEIKEIVLNAGKAINNCEKSNKELRRKLLQAIDIIKKKDLVFKELREKIKQNVLDEESNEDDNVQHDKIIKMIKDCKCVIKRLKEKNRLLRKRIDLLEC